RDSQFYTGVFQSLGGQVPVQSGAMGVGARASQAGITECMKECKDYFLLEEDEEEDDVEQHLDTLKRAHRKFHWDLEEVIQDILDMVVWALQAKRAAQSMPDHEGQQ
ncbi:UNVERIFIED_CONTAM: hypothetical protein K2H54_062012, partial [Gekko kuhli]